MSVTITMNDNPHLLKAIKEMAKALNEPLKIKKQKSKDDFYYSDELLEAVKEAKELKKAYLRGEIKGYRDVGQMMRECLND